MREGGSMRDLRQYNPEREREGQMTGVGKDERGIMEKRERKDRDEKEK